MRERFAVCLPFARHPVRQSGAAIVLSLLTLALVAGIASFVVKDYGASMASISGRHDQAQARLLARGAVDWARNVLAEDARTSAIDHYNEIWATRVPATPVEEGEVGGELDDLSGRFDLNGLARAGVADQDQVAVYMRLLGEVGVPANLSVELATSLINWVNAGATVAAGGDIGIMTAARAPGEPIVDVDELRQIKGYSVDLVDRLRSFVVALPVAAPLNVNTASAEVLVAVVPGLGIDQARILVAQRQTVPFKDLADFSARLPRSSAVPGKVRLSVAGRYFLASVRARYGQSTTRMQALLDRQKIWPEIVWQKLL
jgi:general secretion pathway protein K